MASTSNLLTQVRSKRVLEKAWRAIQENARTSASIDVKQEVDAFAEKATANVNSLCAQLTHGSFKFRRAKGIPIAKQNPDGSRSRTKFRPIVLAPLESRIVQRAILEVLGTVPSLRSYSENAFSFGGIRKKEDSLAAVPAAVQAVLTAIGDGGHYVAFADIRAFFTKIPKPQVTKIIAEATGDKEFTALFSRAITVELENMAELQEKADAFPTAAIGVAQGNSLSPLLGNILLHDFDRQMNAGDCRCIRYIDDFIIIAPTAGAARSRMKQAKRLLAEFDMELSEEKSLAEPIPITQSFNFLGIEFANGLIRPARKAVFKLQENVKGQLTDSIKGMRSTKKGDTIPKRYSLVTTLHRVDGIIRGWGKHYRFCNDEPLFARVDAAMHRLIRAYLGEYGDVKSQRDTADAAGLLGIDELSRQARTPLKWPRRASKRRRAKGAEVGEALSVVASAE